MVSRARSGESFRSIAKWLTNSGFPIGHDSLMRHLRQCVGLDDVLESKSPQVGAALVATTLADFFASWPSAAGECAQLLERAGAHEAAMILQSGVPEMMREALGSTAGSPAGELLAARCLAKSCRAVLPGYPAAVQELAEDLDRRGADDLAEGVLSLIVRGTRSAPAPAAQSTTAELLDAI